MNQSAADKRQNTLKAIRFEKPDHIPMAFHINRACWDHYHPDALKELMAGHPVLFPDFDPSFDPGEPGLNQRAGEPYTDSWGCVWETSIDGITGSVRGHPLADWEEFSGYVPPDPQQSDGTFPLDWLRVAETVASRRRDGGLVQLGLPHGHTFLRLLDIRGYSRLIYDMADSDARLDSLINMITEFNLEIVKRLLALDPDIMGYAEDLGMQVGPMLSPAHFRTYIKPVYRRLMAPARKMGVIVHMHSDGDIRTLADDLIEDGVQVLNLQDLVNGIDWIAATYRGKVCIELDIDRQRVTVLGGPRDVDALIREEVEKLGSPEGGLMMVYGLYPGVPLENAAALMDAMERYA
jgi:uroporphyrinogen decarboxylase